MSETLAEMFAELDAIAARRGWELYGKIFGKCVCGCLVKIR